MSSLLTKGLYGKTINFLCLSKTKTLCKQCLLLVCYNVKWSWGLYSCVRGTQPRKCIILFCRTHFLQEEINWAGQLQG